MELWKYSADTSENDAKMVENCIAVLAGREKPHYPLVCVPCNGSGQRYHPSYGNMQCWNCNGKGHRA